MNLRTDSKSKTDRTRRKIDKYTILLMMSIPLYQLVGQIENQQG